jgi:hypothetical protein
MTAHGCHGCGSSSPRKFNLLPANVDFPSQVTVAQGGAMHFDFGVHPDRRESPAQIREVNCLGRYCSRRA